MGVRRALYEAVRDRITASMPWVRSIDLQKGQFDAPVKNYPLPLPFALVEIRPVTWENYLMKKQQGQTTVSIHLYLDHSGDSLKGAEMESQSLQLLDRMDDLFHRLTDLSGATFKRLVRTGDQVVSYRPRMVIFRCDFQTTLWDMIEPRTAQLPPIETTVSVEQS